jgi:hypothetical protein
MASKREAMEKMATQHNANLDIHSQPHSLISTGAKLAASALTR